MNNNAVRMPITDHQILAQLERLAAGCPWDKVDVWLCREPDGTMRYVAFVNANTKLGTEFQAASADTLEEAVDECLTKCAGRDPSVARERKLAELKEQIAKLQAVVIGLPPYVPNRELAAFNSPPTLDVQSECQEVAS